MKRTELIAIGSAFSVVALLWLGAAARSTTGPTQLTKDEEEFICPAFSPDGGHIAVTRVDWSGIWILSPEGTDVRQLTADPGAGYRFTWSPDGRYIAYRAEELVNGKRYFAIRVVSVDDRSTVEIAGLERFLGTPRWTPDGCVIFQADREGSLGQVRVVSDIDSGPEQRMAHLVAIASPELEIWVCDAESERRTVVSNPGERCFDPVLSPAGDRICYSVLSDGGSIAVAGVDGSERVNLGYGSNPSWSPDGRHLVYEVTQDDGMVITGSELSIVAVDGLERTQLTDTPDVVERWPSWSPDGQRIAFSAGGAIYVMPSPASTNLEE